MSVKGHEDGLDVPGPVLSLRSNHLSLYDDSDIGSVFKTFFQRDGWAVKVLNKVTLLAH